MYIAAMINHIFISFSTVQIVSPDFFLVVYIHRLLVLVGKSKLLFLAGLASQSKRASEIDWLSDSLFVLFLSENFFIRLRVTVIDHF